MNRSSAAYDLSFLEDAFPQLHVGKLDRYRHAPWLKCDFDDLVWRCEFRKGTPFEIDWRVSVGTSGEMLTSATHYSLWLTLRCWLVLSTHPDRTGGRMLSAVGERRRFDVCCDWIDYLLLHADELGLPMHGLKAIVRDDLVAALCRIGSSSKKGIAIYDCPERVESYLRKTALVLSAFDVNAILSRHPFIKAEIPDPTDRLTALTCEEIVRARAWLWSEGFYRKANKGSRWLISSRLLASKVYGCVIRADRPFRSVPELCLSICGRSRREFPAAPVVEKDDLRMRRQRLGEYRESMSSLGILHAVGLEVPIDAIRAFNDANAFASLDLKEDGRFRTLPAPVVFGALRNAIEFGLKNGPDLVTSYLAIARVARNAQVSIDDYASAHSIEPHLAPSIINLGVKQWRIGRRHGALQGGVLGVSDSDYFRQFRANTGLWELLRVYYGSVQITVGTLMARRIGELTELIAGECLDKSATYLIFDLEKSGVLDQRESVAKPIPPVAVRFIRELERLQNGLFEIGVINDRTNLFSYPTGSGKNALCALHQADFSHSNNFFCDYFQLPLDGEGRRYYIRQHQLRRFFAMLFFWSNSFGGLETLRDFMGHANAEHVYRYITEATPGALLRGIKAEWASEAVKVQWSAARDLADLVAEHFHTRNFRVLKDDELAEYIEELIEGGLVTVEPEFLDHGKQYRILIKVAAKELAA